MFLKKLSLTNFKNYTEAAVDFSAKINCFIGNNGEGKTNLLDAIHYLSFCKSFFNSIDYQNIRHGTDFFAIHGTYSRNGDTPETISCIQKLNQKKIFKQNTKEYDRLSDHIGLYPLVMISPYDRDLINDGSEVRRRYIDSVMSQFDKVYLNELINYNKVLAQRNALLKYFGETQTFSQESLDIWNQKMVSLGITIFETRRKFIAEFMPVFSHYYELISDGREKVGITYESQLLQGDFYQLLQQAGEKDRYARYSTVGVHKDDLIFEIDGYPVKKYGSQGQQKSFVVAIKLAQFEYTRNLKGYNPLLLFDDIFDKLDDNRVEQLIKLVSADSFGQVFITDTQRYRIEKIVNRHEIDYRIFEIATGMVKELVMNGEK
ncbi:MAG TPA: DNA replication/repair protein RecF [Bacteroidales bacterium]|nr:DNA replication/repair protein RecF [Bacteroidales bacterium]